MRLKEVRTAIAVLAVVLLLPITAEELVAALTRAPGDRGTPPVAAGTRVRRADGLASYRGLGAWVDIYDRAAWRNPRRTVRALVRRGVRTLFLQTTNYHSRGPIRFRRATGRFLRIAHRSGLRVVAWYVPGFVRVGRDLRWSLAAVRFRGPGGHRFDSLALDIEANILPPKPRTKRLLWLSARLRKAVGPRYTLGAITPSPRGMELSPNFWPGFPYARLARTYDVFVPMAYWTYRTRSRRGAFRYIARSVQLVRRRTGKPKLPIHMIGGLAAKVGGGQMRGFMQAVRKTGIAGASLYDAATTRRTGWAALRGLQRRANGWAPPARPSGAASRPSRPSLASPPRRARASPAVRPDADRPGREGRTAARLAGRQAVEAVEAVEAWCRPEESAVLPPRSWFG